MSFPLCEIINLLAQLLSCILSLGGTLLSGLIAEILALVLELKVTSLIGILCISV